MRWEKFLFRKELLGQLAILNLCLVTFSYPITASIPVLLGVDSTPINIGLRLIYLSLTCYLILSTAFYKKPRGLAIGGWLLLLFWLMYSIRINYDIHVRGIVFGSFSLFKFYTLFYGSGVLTAIATLLTTRHVNLKKLEKYFYNTIVLSNIATVFMVLRLFKSFNPIVIAARVQFSVELADGSVRENVLNPIIIGYYGELLSLLSVYYLLFEKRTKIKRIFNFIGIFIGMYVLIIGGSKGPFVSYFLILIFLSFLKLYRSKKTSMFYLKLFSIPSLIIISFAQFIAPRIPWEKLTMFTRMKSWLTNDYSNSLDNRDDKFDFAWQQFLENPFIGSRYLDQFNSYPHNIFLEVFMALGVIGGLILVAIISNVLFRIFLDSIGNGNYIFFSILVLAQILFGMTSGSLFISYPLWILIALYVSINRNKTKRPTLQIEN